MAHTTARRSGQTGDEADNRFLGIGFDPLAGILFGVTTNLTDHDDGFGVVIGRKGLQTIDEVGAVDGRNNFV